MSFSEQLKKQREAQGLSRITLAEQLGVSPSAVGNYETGVSFPKADVLMQLFDVLHAEPNQLFCDSYHAGGTDLSPAERTLLEQYRSLPPAGREAVRAVVGALCTCRTGLTDGQPEDAKTHP